MADILETLKSLPQLVLQLRDFALPNVHAAVIHFPVALLLTAFLFDLGCLFLRRQTWMDRVASALYVLGTCLAGVAYLTGQKASEAMWAMSAAGQGSMADHEHLALVALVVFAALTPFRLFVTWLGRDDRQIHIGLWRLLALVAALVAQLLLVVTAHLGGVLVYRYGMGVGAETSIQESELELR